MIARTCRCGGRIEGGVCDRCGPTTPDRYRESSHDRGYTAEWDKAAKRYKKQHPLCVVCQRRGIASGERGRRGIRVDHIIPVAMAPELFWNRSNWQTLCLDCDLNHKRPLERKHGNAETLLAAWNAFLEGLTDGSQ